MTWKVGPKGDPATTTTNQMADDWNALNSNLTTSAGRVFAKLTNNTGSVNIFVNGDSTGNSSSEWVYYLAEWYFLNFPQYTVDYYLWNDVSSDFNSAQNIGVGSGSNVLAIYNVSISGSKPDAIFGSKFLHAVKNIPYCDLLILNHGHNLVNSYNSDFVGNNRVPQILEAVLSFEKIHSGAGVVIVAQNPERDTDDYNIMYQTLIEAADIVGADVADVYSSFIEKNKNPILYADNVHPSTGLGDTGTQIFLDKITQLHTSKVGRSIKNTLNFAGSFNYAENGDFAFFDGVVPDNWTSSNATTTKDLSVYESLNGYSVNIAPTSSGVASSIYQNFSSDKLGLVRGGWLTLAVRVFIADGEPSTAGRIALTCQSNNSNNYTISSGGRDGWKWRFLSVKVGSADSYVTVRLYGDSSASNGEAKFDRVILSRGRLPFDLI